jgi:transcriptional regulator with XRE-family HTH domain
MTWTELDRRDRRPEVQYGWEIIGEMVRRRRLQLGWSQRDLGDAAGIAQSAISRLENGKLRGMRMNRFATIVAAMGGLDRDQPAPPPRRRRAWYEWEPCLR